jgi:hypothetical protein
MPQFTEAILPGYFDLVFEYDLTPGVLANLTLSTDETLAQPGDNAVHAVIHHQTIRWNRPALALVSGYLLSNKPLCWEGRFSIEPDMKLTISYIGAGPCNLTVAWTRLTTTHIHEVGQYDRKVSQQPT